MSALDQERWNSGGIVLFAFFFFFPPPFWIYLHFLKLTSLAQPPIQSYSASERFVVMR